jgi:hypothetical protein
MVNKVTYFSIIVHAFSQHYHNRPSSQKMSLINKTFKNIFSQKTNFWTKNHRSPFLLTACECRLFIHSNRKIYLLMYILCGYL